VDVEKDGKEGQPAKGGEGETFHVEIVDKYEGEEKEPLKGELSGSDEKAPADKTGEQAPVVRGKKHEPSLWLAICHAYYKPFVVGALFKLAHDILIFLSPILLKYVFIVTI